MKIWNPWFWDAAIALGTQVCVAHKGAHQWHWTSVRDGFCDGDEFLERMRNRVSELRSI